MAISEKLLKVLCCPACRSDLKEKTDSLICTNGECRRKYRIDQDVPIMLINEAAVLTEEEYQAEMA